MTRWLALGAIALVLSGCGKDDDDSDTTPDKEPGGVCAEGSECITADEYCLILVGDTEGTCTPRPAGCDDICDDCEEATADCESGHSCIAFGSAVTVECI